MPSVRALVLGAAVTVAVGVIVLAWLRAPWPVALVTGGLFGTAFLSIAASLGDDPEAADAAWRAEAADLLGQPTAPTESGPTDPEDPS
jgi:hypothetical protein